MAVRAILFSAVGTAGQRCTSLRRLIVHRSIREELTKRLVKAYASLPIGDPREPATLVGPLIDDAARERWRRRWRGRGGRRPGPRRRARSSRAFPRGGAYVEPAIVEMPGAERHRARGDLRADPLHARLRRLEDAIALQNDAPQGLSSSIFTLDLREAETFLFGLGSDCGIANVNIGPSGAEIGGAFGGEKETGGGRESGSDAWKSLHAPADEHGELFGQAPARAGGEVRGVEGCGAQAPVMLFRTSLTSVVQGADRALVARADVSGDGSGTVRR